MSSLFSNRTFVVTGGSAGLGLSIAQAFWRHGAHVCLVGRDAERLALAEANWGQTQGRVSLYAGDVIDAEQVAQVFSRIRAERGPVFGLVNCVGRSHRAKIVETTPQDLQALWLVNVLSAVSCVRACVEDLVSQRGHLVNIGSLASKVVTPFLGAYPTTKFALAAYTHQLRVELEEQGLHVLLVCPGPLRRDDAGHRYDHLTGSLPPEAARPGGGANLRLIEPDWLAEQIVQACRRRQPELVVPAKVRWLAAIAQLWPRLADSIARRSRKK